MEATRAGSALPAGIVTFLLTDVEGSTAMWEQHPSEMDTALSRHEEIIGSAVGDNGGLLIKSRGEGDSTFSVFTSVSGAASAALDVQRALAGERWPDGIEIRVRMAVHMGEVVERDGDFYGPAVNRAARLRGIASGGEILVSRSAAETLIDHTATEWELEELGDRQLRDLTRPERVWRLGAPPPEPRGGTGPVELQQPPLAAPLASGGELAGREREEERLDEIWRDVVAGCSATLLVSGEPGIGKTALVGAFARRVHDGGAVVLYGRCDEDVGLPYQPFAEAARTLVPAMPSDDVRRSSRAGDLVRLVPDIAATVPGLGPPLSAELDAERWALFEAVGELIATAAEQAPIVLVVDDLHWAGKPTLLLLRHLARTNSSLPVLIVGTYRDTDLTRTGALADTLADLRREGDVSRIALEGLDAAAVESLLVTTAGHELDERGQRFATAVHRETRGNPFFVIEVLRHLAETGVLYQRDGQWTSDLEVADIGLPEGIREVIGRRLSRLSEATNRALTVGAVVGPAFALRVLETIDDAGDSDGLLDALDEAVVAGLLEEDRGTFSFTHALVRQTLLEELSSTRRLRLHRRVGEALESLPDRARHVEALAHHFAEAALDGQAGKAGRYALEAAAVARSRASYEDAVRIIERGLEALEADPEQDPSLRCDLLIELATTHRMFRSWATEDTVRLAVDAAQAARDAGSWDRFVDALWMYPVTPGPMDDTAHRLLETALGRYDELSVESQASLLALKGLHDVARGERGDAERAADRAITLAERIGDSRIIARVHATRAFTFWGSHRVGERAKAAAAAMNAAMLGDRGDQERNTTMFGGLFGIPDLFHFVSTCRREPLERGELRPSDLDVILLRDREALGEWHQGLVLAWEQTRAWSAGSAAKGYAAVIALVDGRWEDAERALDAYFAHGGDDLNMAGVWGGLQALLHRETGRAEQFLPAIVDLAVERPELPAFTIATGFFHADVGARDEVGRIVERFAVPGLPEMPRDTTWSLQLALLAESIGTCDDGEAAEIVRPELEPFEGFFIAPFEVFVPLGPADRFLGILATARRRFDDAERFFDQALDYERRLRSRPMAARTKLWYARMLLKRDAVGDADRARSLAKEALAEATDLEMPVVAAQLGALAG